MAISQTALVKQMTQSLTSGDRRGFRRAIAGLVAIDADLRHNWRTLTKPLLGYGELDLAIAAIDRYVRWAGGKPAALFDQATIYARSGRPEQAQAILERVDSGTPDHASNAFMRGSLALNLGDLPAARSALMEAMRHHPSSGHTAYALASTGSMKADDGPADCILAGAKHLDGAPVEDRVMYLYALGKVHADRADVTAAYGCYAQGAALLAASRHHDPAVDRAGATEATSGWHAATVAAISKRASSAAAHTERSIIVTGLPRSGTTLVEQILISHSAVSEGDELGYLAMLVNEIGGPSATAAQRQSAGHPDGLAAEYHRLLQNRFGSQGRVVDKTVEATRYLGTIAALLPQVPLLYVRRRPLARAWSCFSTYFMSGLGWTFDQAAIADHFRLEEAVLARWQDVLGDRLMIVEYENLVSDKATEIPRLLGHAGLTVEPGTLTPEATARLVGTASVAQVRSPISTTRVDAAEPYRTHLQPFIDAYRAAGGTID